MFKGNEKEISVCANLFIKPLKNRMHPLTVKAVAVEWWLLSVAL